MALDSRMLYAGGHQILRNGGLTDSRRMDYDHTVFVNAQTSGTRLGVTQVGAYGTVVVEGL